MEVDSDEDQPVIRRGRGRHHKVEVHSDDEEDDSVLELDVVVCNEMPNAQLFRVQYPQRQKNLFSEERRTRCRYKKKVKMLEVRVAMDPNSGSYDKQKLVQDGAPAAINRKDPKKDSSIASMLYNVPKEASTEEVYEGRAHHVDAPLNYAVGFVKKGVFYIAPLDGAVSLNRSLDHMNDKKQFDKDFDEESANESDTEANPVRIKFVRPETERQKKRREASALHRERQIASDTWVPLNVYLHGEAPVADKMQAMVPSSSSGVGEQDGVAPEEAPDLKQLVTQAILKRQLEQLDLSSCDESQLSMQRIKELPEHLQVRALMMKARVLSLGAASELLPSIPRAKLVEHLRECAHLVRGNWVLSSEYLFQKLPPANAIGLGKIDLERARLWRSARDLALSMIDSWQPVTRTMLSSLFHLSNADLGDILATLGYANLEDRTWTLRLEEDAQLLNDPSFLHLVVEQKRYWNKTAETILAHVDL